MARKSKWDGLVVGEMPLTGPVEIDVDFLVKNWDDKCWLCEWRAGKNEDFRFIRYRRIGQPTTTHKFTISRAQAAELIKKLNLQDEQGFFASSHSWRKPGVTELSLVQKYVKPKEK